MTLLLATMHNIWLLESCFFILMIPIIKCDQSSKLQSPEVKQVPHLGQIFYHTDCSNLLPGQYLCLDLNIDPATQQPKNCHPQLHYANVTCEAAPGIICHSTQNSSFTSTIPCK